MSIGLDIGTMNIVCAKRAEGGIETQRIRDAFLDLPKASKKVLKMGNVSFVEREGEILLLGDAALEMANIFGKEVRRPLSKGLVSPSEIDSLEVLGFLIKEVIGQGDGQVCFFSVPAAPVDDKAQDIVYHKGVFERIVTGCGYKAIASNEAMAIIFAEAAKEHFSALSFSFGSGMTNIALAFNGIEGMSFSVQRGGDWIDSGSARSLGSTQSRMCHIKEQGIDLANPQSRDEEALTFYYKELIRYVLDWVGKEFIERQLSQLVTRPIPIIISGGTSKPASFLEAFKEELELRKKRMGMHFSDVRLASDQLNAVAKGLLVQAINEEEE